MILWGVCWRLGQSLYLVRIDCGYYVYSWYNPYLLLFWFTDNDLSSPSSSFVGGGGSPQPRPITTQTEQQYYGANGGNTPPRPWCRANRGGVFKRIVRKEDSHSPLNHGPMGPPGNSQGHGPMAMGLPGNPQEQMQPGFFYGSGSRLIPSGYRVRHGAINQWSGGVSMHS